MPRARSEGLLSSLRRLSDGELIARVKELAASERRATALLVGHLAELDTRDVHLREGHSSLFSYCREILALSEHEAYNRIEVARAARRFPLVLDLLAAGSVNLTAVRLLAPHLTPENHRAVLESARGKRKVEIEEIVARLSPRPDVPMSIRKVRRTTAKPSSDAPGPVVTSSSPTVGSPSTGSSAPDAPPAPTPAVAAIRATTDAPVSRPGPPQPIADVTPLSEDRYHLGVTISGTTVEKLRLAKDLLRHALPSGDDAAILDRALTALLTELARKRFAATEKPRPSRRVAATTAGRMALASRYIPADVRRTVWLRDLGRCAFAGTSGRRCGERAFVEFHHVRPFEVGGEASVGNIELRCGRHNRYEERVFFDRGEMASGTTLARKPTETCDAVGAATSSRTSRPFSPRSPSALLSR